MPRQRFLQGHRGQGALRVVYVTNQIPLPAHSGGQLREAELLKRIGRTADVDLFVLTEHYDRDAANAPLMTSLCTGVWVHESTTPLGARPPGTVPERVWRYQSPAFDACLRDALASRHADIVHVEGYFLAEHLPRDPALPVVLVEENIEYLIDRQVQADGGRDAASWQAARARELRAWAGASLVGGVCEEDVAVMVRDVPDLPVAVMPNGTDHLARTAFPREHRAEGRHVAFIGNYTWAPTLQGAWSLVREIWPRVHARMPAARLSLVGAGMPDDLRAAAPAAGGVTVVGEVASVLPTLEAADVFVCPVWTASGVKVKMIEAMAAGCPVVCSRPALRGLLPAARTAVAVADDPRSMADAIVALLQDPYGRRRLAARAVRALDSLPTWDQAAETLLRNWLCLSAAGSVR
ncbi:glycosyltransferase [Streptomyces sp. NPDC001513]|uniref:glycosyltransferase n=1 Tax=Streptomyces sp. NPDC001513 TaxID=3364580 RepID=UPI003692C366